MPRRGRQRLPHLAMERLGQFVEADLRPTRIVGSGVDREDVLHPPDKLGVLLGWDAPLLLQMRRQPVFFRVRRTVSYEIWAPPSRVAKVSASSCKVQRSRPLGGWLQASAVSRACWAPSSLPGMARWRRSSKAASIPSVTARLRKRSMVGTLRAKASAMVASVQLGPSSPWSATKSTRARVVKRFAAWGWRAASVSSSRSASDKDTVYILTIARHSRRWDALSLPTTYQPFKSNVRN